MSISFPPERARPLVAVVGVCASGKTTLVRTLLAHGFNVRQVLQEHSYVPHMWQRLTRPDLLIYLDATLETIRRRRRDPAFPASLWQEEVERLRHARTHCDFYLATDALTPDQVAGQVVAFLRLALHAPPASPTESPG
jgi:shikimate kinase